MKHVIELNDYQVVNLRAALEAIGYPWKEEKRSPLTVLNSGDWVGEIWLKLDQLTLGKYAAPNDTVESYIERANHFRE